MGIQFGEIDVKQIIENEFRILVLEETLSLVLGRIATGKIQRSEIGEIRKKAVETLKKKYPNSGISLSGG